MGTLPQVPTLMSAGTRTRRSARTPGRKARCRATTAAAALAAAVAAATCPSVSAESDGRSDHRARLQRDADAIHARGVVGVQARAVTADGRHLVATSGVAGLRTRHPVSPDGYFRMASTSKTFVATVILQLEEEGRLSLDDTVERRLPGVVQGHGNDGSTITVRQLHRRG